MDWRASPLEPSVYFQPFSRYTAVSILWSRPWPFRVTWRHRSLDIRFATGHFLWTPWFQSKPTKHI